MFAQMMEGKRISRRALAKDLDGITETTVRNFLKYAEAARVRNHFAPTEADAQVAKLSVEQVRTYLKLPEDERDTWLDRGASMEEAETLRRQAKGSSGGTSQGGEVSAGTQPEESDSGASQASPQMSAHAGDTPPAETTSRQGENAGQPTATAAEPASSQAGQAPGPEGLGNKGADGEQGPPRGELQKPVPSKPASSPPRPAPDPDDDLAAGYDPKALAELQAAWVRANVKTRHKFLAGLLTDPDAAAFLRKALKSQPA
jgi:hypothetical protein